MNKKRKMMIAGGNLCGCTDCSCSSSIYSERQEECRGSRRCCGRR